MPELSFEYERQRRWWHPESPAPHVFFADSVVPYIRARLDEKNAEEALRRLFAFVERMAASTSDDLVEIVALSILEPLLNKEASGLDRVWPYLGPSTRSVARSL